MVNAGKKLFDIALQNPTGLGVVFADLPNKSTETIESFVRSFFISTRKRIGDESPVKEWVKFPVNCTVKQTVSNTGFVNASRFRVGNVESFVRSMFVCFVFQIVVK